MKIDLITLQAVNNYGSVLQSFATQEFLRLHGCDVRIIHYRRMSSAEKLTVKDAVMGNIKDSILKLPLKLPFHLLTLRRLYEAFEVFRKNHLNIEERKPRVGMKDFSGYESDADAFCTGSDQVWNSYYNKGILPELYLAWCPEGSYKFAFSASFGRSELSPEEVRDTQKWIDDYRHISVREDSGVKILEEQYHYNKAIHMLDPTLCLSGNTWREYVKTTNGEGGYRR